MVDLVAWTLDTLDSNWSTANYDPQPELINKEDTEQQSTGERSQVWDLAEGNAVIVSDAPERQTTPIGSEYDLRVEDAVSVTVEAMVDNEWGHVADSTEFNTLVAEVKRTLHIERVWPIRNTNGTEHYHTLALDNEANQSHLYTDLYRLSFDVTFQGHEELPSV